MKRVSVKEARKTRPWNAFRRLAIGMTNEPPPPPSADLVEREPFDATYYLDSNPDVAASGMDPYEHYVIYGKIEGRPGTPISQTSSNAEAIAPGTASELEPFDANFYLEFYPDVAASGMDPYEHYVIYGKIEGRLGIPISQTASNAEVVTPGIASELEPFDANFYLELYPDVAASGMNPYEHYVRYGKLEGRIGIRPELKYWGDFDNLDPMRETVLVVTHEASRTGAPILSLNIVRELKKKYNVVSMLLRTGAIEADFQKASNIVVEPAHGLNAIAVTAIIIDQLLERQRFSFAIVNSIESRGVLPVLAKHFVPAITLIHEFAAYTRPRNAFREVALWSSDTVFSAPVILQDAVNAYPDIGHSVSHIIPQGRCVTTNLPTHDNDRSAEDARITNILRPQGSPDDMIVVLGAGAVQLRKGVDLFLRCAARVLQSSPRRPVRFVWIGKGYDPEQDLSYSVYLADQLRRAGLQEHVTFVDETSSIEAAYAAADLMLISSRLDPLPNVAIDAMAHGLPVICFDRTTGIADVLKTNGLGDACVAGYLDVAEMADKTLCFIRSNELRKNVAERLRNIVSEQFNMSRYVAQLETLALAAKSRAQQERADFGEIEGSSLPQLEFMSPPQLAGASREQVIRDYVRTWASGMRQRKPFPGFHPGIYLEHAEQKLGDPFANYLRAGQPAGPWRYELIVPTGQVAETQRPPEATRVALHLHVYYPDLLSEMLQRLIANKVRPDLFVSVPSEEVALETRSLLKDYDGRVMELKIVPNRGRDIGPFLTAFCAPLLENYDIVGHLHTKKTKDVADVAMAETWRNFALEHLLGGNICMADIILEHMFADPSIGMVCPDDPYAVDWGKNRPYAEKLASSLFLDRLPEHFLFPVGTMFWARVEALRSCFELGLEWDEYPAEPLPYDGSMLHALERLLGLCAAKKPFRLVAAHVPGFVR